MPFGVNSYLLLQVSKKRLKKYEKEYSQMKEEMELQDPAECLRVSYFLLCPFRVYAQFHSSDSSTFIRILK